MVADIFVPQRNKPELNDSGDGYCWVTMEDMKTDQIVTSKRYVSNAAIASAGSRVLKRGAVVASCVGNFGIASVLSTDAVINQQLQAYIPRGVSAAYLREVIRCSKRYFDLVGTAATLAYVNQEGFANLPIPLPSIAEQGEIELYIEKNKVKFNGAIFEGIKLIDILKERRSALISAAVTGKIDVRNWHQPADESAFDEEVQQAGMETTA
jgi:type I restriction enzyme S subunit